MWLSVWTCSNMSCHEEIRYLSSCPLARLWMMPQRTSSHSFYEWPWGCQNSRDMNNRLSLINAVCSLCSHFFMFRLCLSCHIIPTYNIIFEKSPYSPCFDCPRSTELEHYKVEIKDRFWPLQQDKGLRHAGSGHQWVLWSNNELSCPNHVLHLPDVIWGNETITYRDA